MTVLAASLLSETKTNVLPAIRAGILTQGVSWHRRGRPLRHQALSDQCGQRETWLIYFYLTTEAQRPGLRQAWIATRAPWPGCWIALTRQQSCEHNLEPLLKRAATE